MDCNKLFYISHTCLCGVYYTADCMLSMWCCQDYISLNCLFIKILVYFAKTLLIFKEEGLITLGGFHVAFIFSTIPEENSVLGH